MSRAFSQDFENSADRTSNYWSRSSGYFAYSHCHESFYMGPITYRRRRRKWL